jgi:hypothetical protein
MGWFPLTPTFERILRKYISGAYVIKYMFVYFTLDSKEFRVLLAAKNSMESFGQRAQFQCSHHNFNTEFWIFIMS